MRTKTDRWEVKQDDALRFLQSLGTGSVDLIVSSPPYLDARTYPDDDGTDHRIARTCWEWIDWMASVTQEAVRICRGLVVWVVCGVTRNGQYQPGPEGLVWECWCRGIQQWRPALWLKNGIPGSGHKQGLRNDWEYLLQFKGPGNLPYADPLACGHVPKYAPGGDCSHRNSRGRRVNQWGTNQGGRTKRRDGIPSKEERPSHQMNSQQGPGLFDDESAANLAAERARQRHYQHPAVANPGNLFWVPSEDLSGEPLQLRVQVGGGHLGESGTHEHHAPFPENLVIPLVTMYCRPGGLVCDPFMGSGTTAAVALRLGRRFLGCDLLEREVARSVRRLERTTPCIPGLEI